MLSAAESALLTQTGPGTPMGALFRRYWLPILLSEEIAERDGAPVPVEILGERLVAFRDTTGSVGLLEERCAHRCASLVYGRNEEGGLRCIFHGWKYDATGQCVDMPTELEESTARQSVRLRAYPVREAGGVVWAYLGPPDKPSAFPEFSWLRLRPEQCKAYRVHEVFEAGVVTMSVVLEQLVQILHHLLHLGHHFGRHGPQSLLHALEILVEDLLSQRVEQLLELLARLRVHEVIVAERLDLAAHVGGQLVQLLLVFAGHVLQHLHGG